MLKYVMICKQYRMQYNYFGHEKQHQVNTEKGILYQLLKANM